MVVGDIPTAVDVVVLGAGPGGYVAAIRAAQLGKQVAIVDPGPPGGTCLHEGCIPSKALGTAADRAWQAGQWSDMGITVESVQVDLAQIQRWKAGVVARLSQGVQKLLDGNQVQIIRGRAWFTPDREIWAETEEGAHRFVFEHCIIATGAQAAPLHGLPFDGQRILTPSQALQLTQRPANLTVIGSDYIAAELATSYVKLGTAVRLLLPAGQPLLNGFDPLAGRMVAAHLRKLGVSITQNVDDPVAQVADADLVVVSDGCTPRTHDLDLQYVGVQIDTQGFITVDDRLRTSNPRIYAVGDVTGGLPLATLAIKQGKVAAEHLADLPTQFNPQAIPRVAWTDPEVAAVGMTTAEAEAAGIAVRTSRFPLAANGRALTLGLGDGAALVVAEAESGVLLGVTYIGTRAADLIGEAALALEMGATLTDLAETLHPHPGLGEALQEAAEGALGAAVHLLMRGG